MAKREARRAQDRRRPIPERRGRGQPRERQERAERDRVQLDAERIVDAAIAIADREGPGAITMRAVAAELDVGVMSLYWHVPSKRHLEGMIAGRLMEESAPPTEPTGAWREDLASIARAARHNMLRHPWMVDLFSSIDYADEAALNHGMLRHIENSLRMVESLPLDFATKMSINTIIDDFTMGFTFSEIIQRRRLEKLGLTEEELQQQLGPRVKELLAEGDYPLFTYFIQHDHELPDKGAQFEKALQIILDGIEVQIERAGPDAP